jgi:ABC-type lipoprotein release transport system permease subunit
MLMLAWRNVWRNFRRSLITTASMGCGLAAIMFGQSMIKSVQHQLVEKATGAITGHLQVQHKDIQEYKFPDKYVGDTERVEKVLASQPGIAVFGKRINITGLVSSPKTSEGTLICAVEPDKESRITTMAGYIVQGEFLGKNPKGIVMGDKLASKLDVRLGEKVVVMAQSQAAAWAPRRCAWSASITPAASRSTPRSSTCLWRSPKRCSASAPRSTTSS